LLYINCSLQYSLAHLGY